LKGATVSDQSTTLLRHSGWQPLPEDEQFLAACFDLTRSMVASLYAVEAARYEEPALIFHARVAPAGAD
jgi:hypothetical protein